LIVANKRRLMTHDTMSLLDVGDVSSPRLKADKVRVSPLMAIPQAEQLANPDAVIVFSKPSRGRLMESLAKGLQGLSTADNARYVRSFWELARIGDVWELLQSAPVRTGPYEGRSWVIFWEHGKGALARSDGAALRGSKAWRKAGIAVSRSGDLPVSLYTGGLFVDNVAVVLPDREDLTAALWAFCSSSSYATEVRKINRKLVVANATLVKVPFDIDHWRKVADELFPDGLPEPWSDDPTQWLFGGRPEISTAPLLVGVARLVGYRWPEQADTDDLVGLADPDGIVCLPSVAGEAPAAERLQRLLSTAYGKAWSPAKARELIEETGSRKKNLADWLRDDFFKQHCALFGNRPFVWHIWDGQRDGFSALVNYHRLDRKTLEKLTYTYLGQDWVERQRAGVRDQAAGAEARLAAALDLQRRLEKILEGEPPYDIYVRWKELTEQPIGWDPDLNDGVRLNIRPFVTAEVLRSPFNIHWRKDRGKNPDGTERHNDHHYTLHQKQTAQTKTRLP
jgi:hypothetical protein